MKRVLLSVLERLGYVLVHADAWRNIQQRPAGGEAPGQAREYVSSSPQMARVQMQIQALERRCADLTAELKTCREQLARSDASGRTRELEEKNRQLSQRIADLEVYLKETRGTGGPSYL